MDDGTPEQALEHAILAGGLTLESFPFLHHSYVLHLGSGTMREVAHGHKSRNRFYEYAVDHHELHYNHHPLGPRLHRSLITAYEREVETDTHEALVAACRQTELYAIPGAVPLPPVSELRELLAQGIDLLDELDRRAAD